MDVRGAAPELRIKNIQPPRSVLGNVLSLPLHRHVAVLGLENATCGINAKDHTAFSGKHHLEPFKGTASQRKPPKALVLFEIQGLAGRS